MISKVQKCKRTYLLEMSPASDPKQAKGPICPKPHQEIHNVHVTNLKPFLSTQDRELNGTLEAYIRATTVGMVVKGGSVDHRCQLMLPDRTTSTLDLRSRPCRFLHVIFVCSCVRLRTGGRKIYFSAQTRFYAIRRHWDRSHNFL